MKNRQICTTISFNTSIDKNYSAHAKIRSMSYFQDLCPAANSFSSRCSLPSTAGGLKLSDCRCSTVCMVLFHCCSDYAEAESAKHLGATLSPPSVSFKMPLSIMDAVGVLSLSFLSPAECSAWLHNGDESKVEAGQACTLQSQHCN